MSKRLIMHPRDEIIIMMKTNLSSWAQTDPPSQFPLQNLPSLRRSQHLASSGRNLYGSEKQQ